MELSCIFFGLELLNEFEEDDIARDDIVARIFLFRLEL